ncbi:4-hydroxy-tetrahydrodipicolinate reductase [Eubacteriaceae bacterium ES3]|nr:4-hydroxy-tetrahydrodipicolinate reductase [Eubacteriaceae bacterium ES3]
MLKIMITGVSGAMGQKLQTIIGQADDAEIVAGFDHVENSSLPFPVYTDLKNCPTEIDAIIDFSHFSAFPAIISFATEKKIPIVIATTGLSEDDQNTLKEASKIIPVFKTANMSVGINLLAKALKEMAATLESGFDIEIIEKHHNKKADAPSGTALLLADAVNDGLADKKTYTYGRYGREAKRTNDELGIHAIRGGTIPGEHSVIFAGNDEIIEIKHTAMSKNVFAEGAVKAARFLVSQQPGLYDMSMVIG